MKPITLIILLLFASACKSNNSNGYIAGLSASKAKVEQKADLSLSKNYAPPSQSTQRGLADTTKKLIREGSISFEASDPKNTRSKILASLSKTRATLPRSRKTTIQTGTKNKSL